MGSGSLTYESNHCADMGTVAHVETLDSSAITIKDSNEKRVVRFGL
jgi:hypothetical protein